ncbi:hypothetical protein E4U31_005133, partial [Claviceps sp. LM219 group G6]
MLSGGFLTPLISPPRRWFGVVTVSGDPALLDLLSEGRHGGDGALGKEGRRRGAAQAHKLRNKTRRRHDFTRSWRRLESCTWLGGEQEK